MLLINPNYGLNTNRKASLIKNMKINLKRILISKARNIVWVEGIKLCDFYATKIFKLCDFLSKLCDFMWLSKSQGVHKLGMNSKVYFKYVYNKELFAKPH